MAPVDHSFDLPAEQFFGFEKEKLAGRCRGLGRSGQNSGRQRARAHQEVDLDLNAVGFSGVVRVAEIPFAQGMFVHTGRDSVNATISMRIDFLIGTPHLQGGTRCLQLVQALGQLDFGPPRIRQECQRKT